MSQRLLIFDVDGTLVDSQHLIVAAMTDAFAAVGHPVPEREIVLGVVGLSLVEAMATLVPHLPRSEAEMLAEHYRESFVLQRATGGDAAHAPLYPGALDALDRLGARPDTLLGIATGKARRGLDHMLEFHDLGSRFVTLQTADGHPSKPHPAMLLSALAETGIAPAHAVMIGDTEFDMAMGRAAGMATIGVSWGYHPRARLRAAGADVIIDNYADLDAALAGIEARVG